MTAKFNCKIPPLGGILRKEQFGSHILLLTIGTILIIFHENISHILPYIIGVNTILISTSFIKDFIIEKNFDEKNTKKLASGIIMFIVGIIIIIQNQDSINLIAISWGIFGLKKGIDELSEAIYNHIQKKKFIITLIHSIIEISLAIILIYNPFEKLSEHIIILGIEYVMLSLQFLSIQN